MDNVRMNLLEESYDRIINVGLCIVPYEDLSDIAAPELMFFGTTKDEKVFSFSELDAMFKSQYEQMAGFVNSLDRKRLFTRTSNDGKNAFITEEVTLTMTSPEEVNTIFMRCSCVMEYIDNQWKLTHLHASTPVDTENDHWHMEEWKREKEKLQKLVDQQTADLQSKNRELKIEAALERIRAQATAMQESSDLLDIVVTMRTEFVNLGHEAHYFWHMRWLPERYEKAMTSGDGTKIGMVMSLPRSIHGEIQAVADWEKSNEPSHILAMDAEKAVDYVQKMINWGDFEQVDPQAPTLDDVRHIGGLTFIMARTTHGEIGFSLPGVVPDPPKDAVETLVRFAGVFDLAYKRFEDLKAAERQHREAQIELALERVRARTMAMQKSEELADVAFVLFEQLKGLDGNLWGTGFGLCKENEDKDEFWFANENGIFPPVSIPNTADPAHKKMYEGWNENAQFLAIEGSGQDLKSHYDYMMTLPEVRPFFQKILDEGLSFPEWQQWNAAYFTHGYLLIITLEPYPDPDILKRFARVFDQTYTRFLDLKRAEAQARESEIQLSLERVRARSMAMHKSDELADLSLELVKQVQALGIDTWFCAFNIYDDHPEGSLEWGSNGQGTFPQYRTPREGVFLDYYEAGQRGETLLINEIGEDECPAHYEYLCSLPGVGDQLLKMKDEGIPFPTYQIDHAAFFKYGYILFITFEPVPEAHDIFKRFAKVFQQTYTRFLDLQKSEEQAREAHIEAALERVRARSMGMHKSDDLIDVVREIGKGIHELGIQLHYSQIYTDYTHDLKTGLNIWVDVQGRDYLEKFHLHYIDHSITLNFYNALNEGLDYFSDRFSKAEKDSYFKLLFKYSDLKRIPKKRKELILNASGWTRFTVILDEATLNFGRYSLDEFTDEEHEIFIRFAKVFGQAYTRFLDLQKAEEQAKEAQIEAALERVRSRSMGMQKSEDLAEVVRQTKMEIMELGIQVNNTQIGTDFTSDPHVGMNNWVSVEGQRYLEKFHIPFIDHPVTAKFHETHENDLGYFTAKYSKSEKNAYFKLLFEHSDFKDTPEERKNYVLNTPGWVICGVISKNSSMQFARYSLEKFSPEEIDVFKRFGKVFEQAYTRFLDLKKAEAQAREAKIETALEKVRSRTMGMQSSDEMPEVANMLFLGVQALGIPAWSSGFNILAEDNKSAAAWMSSEGTLQKPFTLRLWGEASFEEMGAFSRSNDIFMVQELGGKALKEHYNHMKSFPDLKPVFEDIEAAGLSLPAYQINHLCKFAHGFLLFITYEPVPDAHDIFKRFTRVFDQTYTRFLDLKKAEARTKESQIELSLERIRSQVTAMQESSDLFDIVVKMRAEFISLGHEADYFWHMRWLPDVYEMSMTSEDGHRLGMVINVPKFVHDQIPGLAEWEKGNDPIYVLALNADDAWDYIENMNTHGHYEKVDPNAPTRQDIEHIGGLTFIIARTSHGEIGFSLAGVVPDPPKDALDTLERFAGVFDLAYKRFEDLKESERRHRDVQIDLALEKVRSRSIDMRKTSELEDVILMVNEQFRTLKVNITGGAFIVINEMLKEGFYCWGAGGAGDYVQEVFIPPLDRPISTTLGENIKKGTSFFTEHYSNAEKKEFFQHLFKYPPFNKTSPERKKELLELPDGYTRSCVVSEQTSIFIINHHGRVFTEDENYILRQMGRVFEQAYTRFLDLKKASEQSQQIREERDRLEITLKELHATQAQLIQQEKLASLGQLTAGIAHEIKNPLNFVNNFSDLSIELIDEAEVELTAYSDKRSADSESEHLVEAKTILKDIKANLKKIHEHGTRADSIVKSMLEHSRGGTGKLEPTDLNALIKEFVNLSFHGMRAGKNPINVDIKMELDEEIGKVPLIAEDFSRVILNLCNNAFDAMRGEGENSEFRSQNSGGFTPKLMVRTKLIDDKIHIEIEDNGPGIPDEIKDKILQPFFTTKKGTQGTGLGLSITNDIIKAHGGILHIVNKDNQGATFEVVLPQSS